MASQPDTNAMKLVNERTLADNCVMFFSIALAIFYVWVVGVTDVKGFYDPGWLMTPMGKGGIYLSLLIPMFGAGVLGPVLLYIRNDKLRKAVVREITEKCQIST